MKWLKFVAHSAVLLGCLSGLASLAQAQNTPLQCSISAPVTPQIRSEGISELIGDLIIACTGGPLLPEGRAVPPTNIVVQTSAPITNRVTSSGVSDVFLLIDEPGSSLPGAVPTQTMCPTPASGCAIYATASGLGTYDGSPGRPNVFQGYVSGNAVTFFGIPFAPPAMQNYVRVLRITGIRVDARAVQVPTPGIGQVMTAVSSNGAVSLPIPYPAIVTTAYGQPSLNFQVRTSDNSGTLPAGVPFNQCGGTASRFATLRFGETSNNALKPRTVAPFVDANSSPAPAFQNIPGGIYDGIGLLNVETGFYNPALFPEGSTETGLADFGTRMKATITNTPPGVTLWVGTQPVAFTNGVPALKTDRVARLVVSETGAFAPAPATATFEGIPAAQIPVVNGTAQAVWEVLKSTGNWDTFDFPIWMTNSSTRSADVLVTGSFAPSLADPYSDTSMPRFVPSQTAVNLFSVSACRPSLTVSKTHAGNFKQGQFAATYTIRVSNTSAAPTTGTVTLTEAPPSGLSLLWMSGPGWNCTRTSCQRSDALNPGSSYPPVTAWVNVGFNAASPQVNSVKVSGGGAADASATDSTVIDALSPNLRISVFHFGTFTQGQTNRQYYISVFNLGLGRTTGTVTVTDTLPGGLSLSSMTGPGWNCSANQCQRSDSVGPGGVYPPITVNVNVRAGATSPQVNTATVTGGGSATATDTDATDIRAAR